MPWIFKSSGLVYASICTHIHMHVYIYTYICMYFLFYVYAKGLYSAAIEACAQKPWRAGGIQGLVAAMCFIHTLTFEASHLWGLLAA